MTRERKKNILITAGAMAAALLSVGAIVSPGLKVVDDRYVHQAGYSQDRIVDSLTHKLEVDSIFRVIREVTRLQTRADSSLRCLRKNKPNWCAE